jgi:putative PIN family toxin of toxin-antitoxin system
MRVVIDTNVLLVSISRKSQFNKIFRSIIDGTIELCISNAVLEEYLEKIAEHWSVSMSESIAEVLLKSPFVSQFDPRFNWTLITADPDDDKFTDCYIAASAQYLVTDDKHFNVLKRLKHPPVNIISSKEFLSLFKKLK